MSTRRTFRYTPYVFLTLLTATHEDKSKPIETTQRNDQLLLQQVQKDTVILGPTPTPISKIKDRYRYQCMIKYRHEPNLRKLINQILDQFFKEIQKKDLQIIVDMQPYQLM